MTPVLSMRGSARAAPAATSAPVAMHLGARTGALPARLAPRPAGAFRRSTLRADRASRGRPLAISAELSALFSLPTLGRMICAGVLLYTSANWVTYRRWNRQAEKVLKEREGKEGDRQDKLKRLQPQAKPHDKQDKADEKDM